MLRKTGGDSVELTINMLSFYGIKAQELPEMTAVLMMFYKVNLLIDSNLNKKTFQMWVKYCDILIKHSRVTIPVG